MPGWSLTLSDRRKCHALQLFSAYPRKSWTVPYFVPLGFRFKVSSLKMMDFENNDTSASKVARKVALIKSPFGAAASVLRERGLMDWSDVCLLWKRVHFSRRRSARNVRRQWNAGHPGPICLLTCPETSVERWRSTQTGNDRKRKMGRSQISPSSSALLRTSITSREVITEREGEKPKPGEHE